MRVQPRSNLLFHRYGDEAVILNMDTESYFTLNETAIRMWELLGENTVEQACVQMAEEYDAPLDVIQVDVQAFIQSLKDGKLVDIVADPA
ncbi:MAG: PqqD family protein [Chloroflexi bacterium]|nr:PqqD family protein [Chloroflexota bacterium]